MVNFFTFYRDKYKKIIFTITDADTKLPVDLTSATFNFTVKRSVRDADSAAIFIKTLADGMAVVDAPNGKVQVEIDPTDTSSRPLVAQAIEWDLQIVRSGNPEIAIKGTGEILIPVTRAAS